MPAHTTYRPHERPECEVQLEDGRWVSGEVRQWTRADDGSWTANVLYQPATGENRLDNFPGERVRQATLGPGLRSRVR